MRTGRVTVSSVEDGIMRRGLTLTCCFLCFSSLACGQTADEIVAKLIAARGGREKMSALNTIRKKGIFRILFEGNIGVDAPLVIEEKRPNRIRQVFLGQALVYDGQGTPDPGLQVLSDLNPPYVDSGAKGYGISLEGKAIVRESEAYKLKITRNDGSALYYFISAATWLPVKVEFSTEQRAGSGLGATVINVRTEMFFSAYKDVAGMQVPHEIDVERSLGGHQRIMVQQAEVNVPLDDAPFSARGAQ